MQRYVQTTSDITYKKRQFIVYLSKIHITGVYQQLEVKFIFMCHLSRHKSQKSAVPNRQQVPFSFRGPQTCQVPQFAQTVRRAAHASENLQGLCGSGTKAHRGAIG